VRGEEFESGSAVCERGSGTWVFFWAREVFIFASEKVYCPVGYAWFIGPRGLGVRAGKE
jgi:hypothetical protein